MSTARWNISESWVRLFGAILRLRTCALRQYTGWRTLDPARTGHLASKEDGSRGLSAEELSHVDEVVAALKELVGLAAMHVYSEDVQHSTCSSPY